MKGFSVRKRSSRSIAENAGGGPRRLIRGGSRAGAAVLLVLAVCLYFLASQHRSASEAVLAGAEERRDRAERTVQAIASLRAQQPVALDRPWPAAELLERLQPHLSTGGIPSDALIRHALREPSRMRGGRHELHGVQLSFSDLTPAAVLEVLVRWRAQRHPWAVTEIRFTHAGDPSPRATRSGRNTGVVGGAEAVRDRYTVQIEFQALAVVSGGSQ